MVIDMQTHMIAAPAVSPHDGGTGEGAKAEYLMNLFKTMKFDELYVINIKDPKSKPEYGPILLLSIMGKIQVKIYG